MKKKNSKIALLVQCRLSSTRLKNKILLKINKKYVLDYFIARALAINVNEIIFIIANEKNNFKILQILKKNPQIKYYIGSKLNVLKRTYFAAKKFNIDTIVRVTSDCPIFDPRLVNEGIKIFEKKNVDYVCNNLKKTWPHGLDFEIFSFKALSYAFSRAKSKYDLEHVTPFIKRSKIFKKYNILNNINIYNKYRWTLDTEDDFSFFTNLLNKKKDLLTNFNWKKIKKFVDRNF